jgi:hypothetical protein
MPETLESIQAKHEKAMASLEAKCRGLMHTYDKVSGLAVCRAAREAFAAALKYHADYLTKLKAATKVAREIEDASTKGQ